MRGGPVLQVTVDPAHGELKPSTSRPRHGLGLSLSRVLACLASGHFWLGGNGLEEDDELWSEDMVRLDMMQQLLYTFNILT